MKNIVLVGFMGTGKTTVGKLLARRLNMAYISTDNLIVEREKTIIPEIFSGKGESYFRKIEKEVVRDVSQMKDVIIDAGGGVIIDPENVANLKKESILICLWATPKTILERTKKCCHRPLLNVANPMGKIEALLNERKPFYERAEHHVHTSGMTAEKVAEEIEKIARETQKK